MFKAVINSNSYLALFEKRHAEELFNIIDGSRDQIGKWLSFPTYTNEIKDTELFIEKSLSRYAANNGFWAGIWHQGKLAGSIGYLYVDQKNLKTEIGYWLSKDFEGLGLATKACKLLIDYAFKELSLNKVEINVAVKNHKSRAIPVRLGFTEEGVIRHYEFLNGEYLDRVIYGMLRGEWVVQD
jgi:ribosomal-protein-serine acetyltransferase